MFGVPRGAAAGNTCASMEKLRILGPKTPQMIRFWGHFSNFRVHNFSGFFQHSGSFQCIQNDVFWCPGGPGTIPDWSLIDLRSFIFFIKIFIFEPLCLQGVKIENRQYRTKLRFECIIRCSFSWETRWCSIKVPSNPWPRLSDHRRLSECSAEPVITIKQYLLW